ncbi:MFS transporter [Casimicrobium huifangae]|uniref:MFS transporter n=1 Tax=Casimicrobium huifangae TaxID=2591109 RepID=UPI0012EBB307|nr:MFS transporter [Casimicrobium huifangae]
MTTRLLLYFAHAIDHLALLIFATAVSAIAVDFGLGRWEDLMPYATGAFVMFGIASLPAGRYGDLWGRRAMMIVFFFGMGVSLLLVALTRSPLQIGIALTLMGAFSAIYHPVGIPMLLQHAKKAGAVIGVNGLAGNLGIAFAALLTGFLVKHVGWRAAFAVPGVLSLVLGAAFVWLVPREAESPAAKRGAKLLHIDHATAVRVFAVLTCTTTLGSLIFNFTTNGNGELLRERAAAIASDPAALGLLLAGVYAIASLAQVIVGRLIDRFPIKRVFLPIVAAQVVCFLLAARADGWWFYVFAVAYMTFVFGAIPFTDAIIARFVDDSMRSRVAGLRLAVSFGFSSLAVWALGPFVKASGFTALLFTMAVIASLTLLAVSFLPARDPEPTPA